MQMTHHGDPAHAESPLTPTPPSTDGVALWSSSWMDGRSVASWGLVLVAYLALAVVLSWPLALHLSDATLGYPSPDNMDTAQLRRVVAMGLSVDGTSRELFPPVGYNAQALMPNLLDHWLALPLVRALPWPLADNLWWLAVLALNGVAGHAAGWALGGSHRSGVLCGVAFACAEPVLREANMGHAPQALACSGPLVVWGLVRCLASDGTWRHSVGLGSAMALAGCTYWYFGMFFGVLCLPPVVAAALRSEQRVGLARVAVAATVCLGLIALPAWLALGGWDELAMTDRGLLPAMSDARLAVLPATERFLFSQSGGLDWLWARMPPDRSNRLTMTAVIAAALATRSMGNRRWRWWIAAALGGVLLMGPFLSWLGAPVVLNGRPIALPWYWIAQLSPILERLHWPQRWGVVVPLALLPLLARSHRPLLFAALVVMETLAFSPHAPTSLTPTTQYDGWRVLAELPDEQAVLVLPLDPEKAGDTNQTALLGLAYRAAEQPLVAETRLPGGAQVPLDWKRVVPRLDLLNPDIDTEVVLAALKEHEVGAVVLDVTPGGSTRLDDVQRYRKRLERRLADAFGAPEDHGSILVWWVSRPASAAPPPTGPTAWRVEQYRSLDAANRAMDKTPHAAMRWNIPREYRTQKQGGRGRNHDRPHPQR